MSGVKAEIISRLPQATVSIERSSKDTPHVHADIQAVKVDRGQGVQAGFIQITATGQLSHADSVLYSQAKHALENAARMPGSDNMQRIAMERLAKLGDKVQVFAAGAIGQHGEVSAMIEDTKSGYRVTSNASAHNFELPHAEIGQVHAKFGAANDEETADRMRNSAAHDIGFAQATTVTKYERSGFMAVIFGKGRPLSYDVDFVEGDKNAKAVKAELDQKYWESRYGTLNRSAQATPVSIADVRTPAFQAEVFEKLNMDSAASDAVNMPRETTLIERGGGVVYTETHSTDRRTQMIETQIEEDRKHALELGDAVIERSSGRR